MASFLKAKLQRLRPSLTCLSAFAAGCFLISDVLGQDVFGQDTQSNKVVPTKNLDQLFSDKDVWTMPMSSPSRQPVQLDQRPAALSAPSQSPVPTRIQPGPSVSDFLGGVRQASNQTKSVNARVVVSEKPAARQPSTTWEAPTLPTMPKTIQMKTTGAEPFVASQVQSAEPADPSAAPEFKMPVTRVSQAGFEDPATTPTTSNFGQTVPTHSRPVEHVAGESSNAKFTGVHHLKNVGLKDFETKVVGTWGDRLAAKATEDGRYVTVELPTRVRERMLMVIDRKTQTLNFQGDESLKDNWHRLVASLDSMPQMQSDGTVVQAAVVDTGKAETNTIKQVAYLVGLIQDQDGTTGTLQLPGNINPQDIPEGKLKGNVKLIEDPETGALTIVASPDDIAVLKKIIEDIKAQAAGSQPVTKSIPLNNVQSQTIFEQVQTAYDAGYAQANGPVQLIPVESPNMIVVIGQPAGIKAVESIVATVDVTPTEKGPMEGFKAFRLKYIAAVDARDRLQTYFSQANLPSGNTLPSEPVNVIADFRSNTVVVKGSQRNIEQAEAFLKSIDVVETGAANAVRIFPLKNTLAEEMAIVIQDAINGQQPNAGSGFNPSPDAQSLQNQNQNVQVDPNQSQLRGAGLTLKTIADNGQEIVGSIMFDVRVTADRNSNSLVVTGPEESMALVAELIKQLDRLPDAETQIKVFEIVNGDAQALLDMLEALFGTDQNAGLNNGTNTTLSQLPLQGAGTDGQTLVNLRFSIDPRTNTIIASGPAGDLQVVEDLLNRLDAADVNKSTTSVYRLSNAPALDISEALTTWLDTRSDIIETDPRTNYDQGVARRAINVVPEIVSNSLIVTARPEYQAEIEGIIRALDRRPPMVQVKVLIAEVDLSTLEEFGVEVGIQDSLLFDRGTVLGASNDIINGIGFPFNSTNPTGNLIATSQNNLAGQALSNLGIGRINNELGYGGLVLSAGSESVNVLMRALKDRQCVRVLSSPQIMTLENLQGRISIGSEVPRISGTTQSNFGVTQDITFVDVGVILEVTPRVSPDGLIVMAVNAKRSSVGGDDTAITIGFGNDGSPIRAPQIIETEANTTLMARSGQTVVFSGLIQEDKAHGERGAPILSDLPIIGPLFKFETDSASRSELVIIMTPTLVTDEQDIAMINEDATQRMHWCECDVADVFGSTVQSRHGSVGDAMETYRPASDPTGGMPIEVNGQMTVPMSQNRGDSQTQNGVRKASHSDGSKR